MVRSTLVAAAILLTGPQAWAQFNPVAQADLAVSELKDHQLTETFTMRQHEVVFTWSGSCAAGATLGYSNAIRGTGGDPWLGEWVVATDSPAISGTHTEWVDPGRVVWASLSVGCSRGLAGGESAVSATPKYVLPPVLEQPLLMIQQPAEFFSCFPVGKPVLVSTRETNAFTEGEKLTVVFRGAGIDYEHTFQTNDEKQKELIALPAATGAGEVEHYVIKHPADGLPEARSNVLVLRADSPEACSTNQKPAPKPDAGTDPGATDLDEERPGDDEDEEDPRRLCSTSAIASPQLVGLGLCAPLLAVWLARRRRA